MAAFASEPAGLDEEARAELLCYLVVGQIIAVSRTGEWLRTDHLVESIRIWLASNGAEASWSERFQLGALSQSWHTISVGYRHSRIQTSSQGFLRTAGG